MESKLCSVLSGGEGWWIYQFQTATSDLILQCKKSSGKVTDLFYESFDLPYHIEITKLVYFISFIYDIYLSVNALYPFFGVL